MSGIRRDRRSHAALRDRALTPRGGRYLALHFGQARVVTTEACGRELAYKFGNAFDDISDLAETGEVLPPGFDAYTCVFHALFDPADVRVPYSDSTPLTWDRTRTVQHRIHHGPDDGLSVSEGSMDEVSAPVIIEMLGIGGTTPDYIVTPEPHCGEGVLYVELGGDTLAERLDDRHMGPTLWFPKTIDWVCATPWDGWQTYIASDDDLAARLRDHQALETISSSLPARRSDGDRS